VGWLIDQALNTLPLFLFLGLIVGIAMGVLATRAELKRYF
jgi:F0F1-type ATP synthase assembly protein I